MLHNSHHFRKARQLFFLLLFTCSDKLSIVLQNSKIYIFNGKFHSPGALFSTLRKWHSHTHLFTLWGKGYISDVKEVGLAAWTTPIKSLSKRMTLNCFYVHIGALQRLFHFYINFQYQLLF